MDVSLRDRLAVIDTWEDAIPCGPEHDCAYLPGRAARERAFVADEMDPLAYHDLMEHGYRRSGTFYYKPACDGCAECVPMRVPVEAFRPSRSQRRVWRRNADLRVELGRPIATDGRHELFVRYLQHQHDGAMSGSYDDYCRFLCESQVDTREISYWLDDKLIGVGIVDQCSASLSTVYFYFDPAHGRRSLGVYSTLWEISYAQRLGVPYYYLGYYVRDARTMRYKVRFRPNERRMADGTWRRFDGDDGVSE